MFKNKNVKIYNEEMYILLNGLFNLETAVGRARVCVWHTAWQGATRRMVIPCNEEQRSQAAYQACKRVRSNLTHRVGMSEGSKLTIHRDSQRAEKRSTAVFRFNAGFEMG